jgi:capsular polysaccharide biosynthesis protein
MIFIMEKIFLIRGRGGDYLYHFIVLEIGGLYYIMNDKPLPTGNDDGAVKEKIKLKYVNDLSEKEQKNLIVSKPLKIFLAQEPLLFQKECIELIKDDIELISTEDIKEIYYFQPSYGVPCVKNLYGHDLNVVLPFLRNLFLKNFNFTFNKNKRIFITRRNSEAQHNGQLKRCILNEEELKEKILKRYNIEYIQLENYSFKEKIELFNTSSLIISTHSGGLTCSLWANKKTKIVEILNRGTYGFPHGHYINITSILNIPYYRYTKINEDYNGNFNLNCNKFEEYIKTII